MTLILCPNLAVDRVVSVDELTPGSLLRPRALGQQAGGKGANVLRALLTLGGHGVLTGFAAGRTGRLIGDMASDEGLEVDLIGLPGEARICTVILEGDGRRTELFEIGPSILPANERALADSVRHRPASPSEWAVVTGSAPPGATPDFYATLVGALTGAGYRVMLDATGNQLRHALAARPHLVKVNRREASEAAGPIPDDERSLRAACRQLIALGAREAVITNGGAGAVAVATDMAASVATPQVHPVNSTGSGDSFAAALAFQLERNIDLFAALPLAAGAGAANATTAGTAQFESAFARRLAEGAEVRLVRL